MTHRIDDTTPLDLIADSPQSGNGGDEFAQRMGRDARRVTRGELSQEVFYERYHEEILARFGFDRRPGGEDR
ncbi:MULTISPECIES: 4Fe-4S ferredoxin N-terminal domain-containing protein [Haloferax]|uniref:4Fe-4S ferredoxin iron-sulfur binding domain-containing protein n=1 Tax=Haloferax marinum TaxID=2666143 RepID=A0A6A8GCP7_9EURY|nr:MULTISPECIES: 4Fe-4S ferredoxin N-terminal domain-containing protein [Haloferax]KAB1190769.1 hypothetical protein Hfx1150_17205 [Haloferax sp. CBA1150]MRW98308.1 hypothetical protein [Haloferax marinum]